MGADLAGRWVLAKEDVAELRAKDPSNHVTQLSQRPAISAGSPHSAASPVLVLVASDEADTCGGSSLT